MTLLLDISTMYASMFSLVLFMILFESRFSKKKTLGLTLSLIVPLMFINFGILIVLGPEIMSTLLLATCTLPSLAFFWFLAKYRDGRFFFTFCMADTLVLEVIHITMILDYFLGNTYLFMLIARLILCPLLALFIHKCVKPTFLLIQNSVTKGWYILTAIALTFYIVLSIFVSIPVMITERPEQLTGFILLLILLPAVYIHIFGTLGYQLELHQHLLNENILHFQVTNLKTRIAELNHADESHRTERHDFRHKIQTIADLIDRGNYDKVQTLAEEYIRAIPDYRGKHYCDHVVLDAVFSAYLRKAEAQKIQVITHINFPDVLPANESELSTVFANAIENAIHACSALEPADRLLEIKVLRSPCFMFQIRNTYGNAVTFDSNNIPVADQPGHGFGTRSIVTFCQKNGCIL